MRIDTKLYKHSYEMRHNPTDAESRLWTQLRSHRLNGIHFRRQHVIGSYIVDFCSPRHKLIIELDGGQHLDQQTYDQERNNFLASKGYRILRFWNNEILGNMEVVLTRILEE